MPSQNGVWPIKMTSQKCQSKHSKKIHDPITMDKFKMTCPKWLKGVFYACPKWVFFTKVSSKKIKNYSSEFNNPFKYKYETSQKLYASISKNYGEFKMQLINNGFNNM